DGVDDAIRFVEMLRNQEKVTDARIFRMEEVPIEIRTYYKVEVAGEEPEPLAPVPPAVANALPETSPPDAPLDPMPLEVGAGTRRAPPGGRQRQLLLENVGRRRAAEDERCCSMSR